MITTKRLTLRKWQESHREAFAQLHAHPEVMADLGGPIDRTGSDRKFDRYREAQDVHGIARWAVETPDGAFIGYAGVMPRLSPDHPLGAHHEVGWRFVRSAWGNGYATESARAALDHAVGQAGINGIISYTAADNLRSQAVMKRLGLVRRPSLDFSETVGDGGQWHGLVWALDPD